MLQSTTHMADLRTTEAQVAMLKLHPRRPPSAVLPALPPSAPSVPEDDTDTPSASRTTARLPVHPAGRGGGERKGNMLAIFSQSDICRLGVVALLRDIINGELPDDAHQLLLASRLVALANPGSDGYRPNAVGELFYRLAAIAAVRKVGSKAAVLLAPHQYGVGVAACAEKIIHSLQHKLTDADKRLAMLQICHCIQTVG